MNRSDIRSVLITGANAGLGKEIARQLAMRPEMQRIYLGCRNEGKALAAKSDLERQTGKSIFKIILIDLSDLSAVRNVVKTLESPVDALVMNAGGAAGKTPLSLTRDGVTELFAKNVLGHVALLEGLISAGKLTQAAVYLGSEAARGVPKLGMKRPALPTSSVEDFVSIITGKDFEGKKFDGGLAYGEVKYVAAMWMAATAHLHPGLKIVTVSPGNTRGTNIADSMPVSQRIFIKYLLMPIIAPLFGLAHSVQNGAERIIAGLIDPSLKSGNFYASGPEGVTGPMMDQSKIFPDLANRQFQERANEAVHRYL
jgi:NAD(P)-dependent dehydrogenase (short-subunit alcohol dehydrogenase family)